MHKKVLLCLFELQNITPIHMIKNFPNFFLSVVDDGL